MAANGFQSPRAPAQLRRDDEDLEKPEAGSSYTFVNRNNSQYGQPVTDAIFAAANGVPTVFEDENSIFLFTRYDITENVPPSP